VGRSQYIAEGNRQTLQVTNACSATDETDVLQRMPVTSHESAK